MALRDQPYIPLYVQDFLTDEKLMECSAEATGVYIKIMCIMHKSEPYGNILLKQKDKQKSSNIQNFALKLLRHLPYSLLVIEQSLRELIDEDVLQLNGDFLSQKRMIRDCELSIKRANAGQKGGKKTQKFASNFALAKSEANSESANESESEKESVPKKEKKKVADFVSMTDGEKNKLIEKFGEIPTKGMIEILNNYKGANGKKYKSDYLAILNWVVKRYFEENKKIESDGPKISTKKRWGIEICPHCEKSDIMVVSESSKGAIFLCKNDDCGKEFEVNNK